MKTYIGIDNGTTGSIALVSEYSTIRAFFMTPVFSQLNYTKEKKNITRIDRKALLDILVRYNVFDEKSVLAVLERPMVNPQRFNASLCAVRALESTLGVLEDMEIPYMYIDSKEWQKAMLPHGVSGDSLKSASKDIGIRLFPEFKDLIVKHKDADSLLIAEYSRRKGY